MAFNTAYLTTSKFGSKDYTDGFDDIKISMKVVISSPYHLYIIIKLLILLRYCPCTKFLIYFFSNGKNFDGTAMIHTKSI